MNQFQLGGVARLDLSVTFYSKQKPGQKFSWDLNASVYNAYNRMNPYFIYIDPNGSIGGSGAEEEGKGELKFRAKQVSLFPILPSVTWNFKF